VAVAPLGEVEQPAGGGADPEPPSAVLGERGDALVGGGREGREGDEPVAVEMAHAAEGADPEASRPSGVEGADPIALEPLARGEALEAPVAMAHEPRPLRPDPQRAARVLGGRPEELLIEPRDVVAGEDAEAHPVEADEPLIGGEPEVAVARLADVEDDVAGKPVLGGPAGDAEAGGGVALGGGGEREGESDGDGARDPHPVTQPALAEGSGDVGLHRDHRDHTRVR